MICVGMVTFITIFASSTKAAANTVYDRSFTGDFIINSGAGGTGGVDPALARRVSQLPQVALASGLRAGMAKIEGGVQQVLAVHMQKIKEKDLKRPGLRQRRDVDAAHGAGGHDLEGFWSAVAAQGKHLPV